MGEIFGIWDYNNRVINNGFIEGVMSSFNPKSTDYTGKWMDKNIAFGASLIHSTSQSIREKLPYHDDNSGCVIVADARIDYREELVEKLELDWQIAKDLPDSRLILNAYLIWGEEFVNALYGDFALAIWDSKRMKLICARDQIGVRPLYYLESKEYFAFASSIKELTLLGNMKLNLEDQYIIDSLMLQQAEKAKSPFHEILSLEPASYLSIDVQNRLSKNKYWDLTVKQEFTGLNEPEAIAGLRKRILHSVNERLRSAFHVGCELSGGLDSSSVASIASSILTKNGDSLLAFTQSLSEAQKKAFFPFADESEYSKLVSTSSKIKDHCFITGEERGILESIQNALARLLGPYGPNYAVVSDLLFEKAQEKDVRIMLSGFGGDEGISSSGEGYYKDLVLSRKWRLLFDQFKSSSARTAHPSVMKTFRFLIYLKVRPLVEIYSKILFYCGIQPGRYKYIPLQNKLKNKYHTKKLFYKSKVELKAISGRSKMYNRISSNYVTDRVQSTTILSKAYNIEYRYPLLDVKLLEYFYSLPSHLKYKNGMNRYLFRMAMEGLLPDEIRWRKDKSGFTVPNVHYRIKIDEEKCKALIHESREQNKFHYLDYKKLIKIFEKMLNREKKGKIGYGNMIFLTSLGVLTLQKWQREGKIDIGIKC